MWTGLTPKQRDHYRNRARANRKKAEKYDEKQEGGYAAPKQKRIC